MKRPPPKVRGSSFGFTLAGIFIGFAITIATVYVGLTAMPVFALITGWAEGYMLFGSASEPVGQTGQTVAAGAAPRFAFRRVVA
jgi:hypothetical protein